MQDMRVKNTNQLIRFSSAALLFGASLGVFAAMLGLILVPTTPAATTAAAETALEEPETPPAPTVFPFVEIVNSCDHNSVGTCAVVYGEPAASHATRTTLRNGIVLKVGDIVQNDGEVWYQIVFDEWVRYPDRVSHHWYVRARDARVFFDVGTIEYTPDMPVPTKHIIVDRSDQMLYAYEGDTVFMQTPISTGLLLTPTPRGTFTIYKKTPSRYMQGPLPGISDQYYDLPGVPWTLYFTQEGAAIHGAYWHNNFGQRWSHGCVNVSLTEAETLYRWADVGTQVIVRD